MKRILNYFSKFEIILWFSSILFITVSFLLFDRSNYLTLAASLIGATALIFNAKGNPFGQFLMVGFSIIYGIISYTFAYYGEMITYLGMSGPIAMLALISWLKNPYKGNRNEVEVEKIGKREVAFIAFLTLVVTAIFYFILKMLGTANLFMSTVSITTSFAAVYLTFRRSPYFALLYALNDIVLIVLWSLATITDISYISVIICFIMFLVNDLYGFINWRRIQRKQAE